MHSGLKTPNMGTWEHTWALDTNGSSLSNKFCFCSDLCNMHCTLVTVAETITQALCPTARCYLLINPRSRPYLPSSEKWQPPGLSQERLSMLLRGSIQSEQQFRCAAQPPPLSQCECHNHRAELSQWVSSSASVSSPSVSCTSPSQLRLKPSDSHGRVWPGRWTLAYQQKA